MSQPSATDRLVASLLATPPAVVALPPLPPESANPALDRCRAAWQQTFDEYMRKHARRDGVVSARYDANKEAGIAYCGAMPPLIGAENIRDFIACVAYGILIAAIPQDRAGQLLYAAQVAVTSAPRTPKAAQPAQPSPLPPPPPHENALSSPQNQDQLQ